MTSPEVTKRMLRQLESVTHWNVIIGLCLGGFLLGLAVSQQFGWWSIGFAVVALLAIAAGYYSLRDYGYACHRIGSRR